MARSGQRRKMKDPVDKMLKDLLPRGSEIGKSPKDLMDFDSKDQYQSTLKQRRQAVLELLKRL